MSSATLVESSFVILNHQQQNAIPRPSAATRGRLFLCSKIPVATAQHKYLFETNPQGLARAPTRSSTAHALSWDKPKGTKSQQHSTQKYQELPPGKFHSSTAHRKIPQAAQHTLPFGTPKQEYCSSTSNSVQPQHSNFFSICRGRNLFAL